ncbi:MAG: gliding motility-associated C-terminal domain-containing protein [Flavobacteriales bacterium]
MKHFIVTTLLVVILYNRTSAQREANIWHFGFGQGFDFNSGEAVQISGAMQTNEGCAAYCDSAGNILFYSNGGGRLPLSGQNPGTIWNANNEVMYDMQGLEGGGFSAAQSSVIIPAPGEPNVYYLFTMEEAEYYVDSTVASEPFGRGLRYFKIDMSLNNGLGEVIEADVPVYDYSYEGLCAIRHVNETDYWILINQDTTGIGVYSVTAQGVELTSVYESEYAGFGTIKAAPTNPFGVFPCCEKVVASGVMYDFDRTTGLLSNPDLLPGFGSEAMEFSSNSRYLYSTLTAPGMGTQQLVRYDLVQADELQVVAAETQEIIADDITAYYMQLAPDQKIYYTYFDDNFSVALGTINCVNSDSPTVTTGAYSYEGTFEQFFATLPNFPAWIFYESYEDNVEFGPDTVYLCEGDSIILDAGHGDYWEWGGDCYSGPEETWPDNATRYFTVTEPGSYSACVNGPCSSGDGAAGCSSSDQITVLPCEFSPLPSCDLLSLPDSLTLCAGDTLQLEADLSQFESYAGLQWIGGGTFLPSDTVAQPLYIPSAQEVAAGTANLTLQVFIQEVNTDGGNFLAYDHSGDDAIFYISTVDGSVEIIQSNTGNDWTAMGFSTASNQLYGVSNIVTAPALSSVNIETGEVTPIFTYPDNQFYAGDFDNVNEKFYVIGIPEINSGELLTQTLYTIDITSGTLDAIGDLSLQALDNYFVAGENGINGLAYDPSLDVLWAATANGQLLEIDPSNAVMTVVGSTVIDMRGLAYDYNANELWGVSANGTLHHINKLTGELIEEVICQEPLSFVTTLTYALPENVTENICSDNIALSIRNEIFNVSNDTLICEGETVLLNIQGFENYLWQDGSSSSSYTVDESGSYNVNVTDAFGCNYSDAWSVTVLENPDAAFVANPQPAAIADSVITFTSTNNSTYYSYEWTFEEGSPEFAFDSIATVRFPPIPGEYEVTLVVSNSSGCIDSLRTFIVIESDGSATMPNIFTPNGDGKNDRFIPLEDYPGDWQLTIFNRWGLEIFTTENLFQGWSGEDVSAGSYYWVLEPRDGQQGKSRAGYVMLVRN